MYVNVQIDSANRLALWPVKKTNHKLCIPHPQFYTTIVLYSAYYVNNNNAVFNIVCYKLTSLNTNPQGNKLIQLMVPRENSAPQTARA